MFPEKPKFKIKSKKYKSNQENDFEHSNIGPNINLKCFKKNYESEEEKNFLTNKIRIKKKTELCKNWELYHACYFEDECCFAHGSDELRSGTRISGSKNKKCKSFQDRGFCIFGKRCNYRHTIKEKRLFTYQFILEKTSDELKKEILKKENSEISILKLYKKILLKRKVIM